MAGDTLSLFLDPPRLTLIRSRPPAARHHHFVVHDRATGAFGAGGAADELSAQRKALFEWIERRAFRESGRPTSSGWAAHTSPEAAERAAALELVERDALLCSWLLKIPPRLLGEIYFAAYARSFPLLQFAQGKGFFVMGVVVESSIGRMLLGTTCETRAEGAAKLEIDAERARLVLEKGAAITPTLMPNHFSFCAASPESLSWLTLGGAGLHYGELSFTYRTMRAPLWDGSVAYVCRASCAELQPLYHGRGSLRTINRCRLRALGYRAGLNRERHPLL